MFSFGFPSVCILAIGESSSPWLSFTIAHRCMHLIFCSAWSSSHSFFFAIYTFFCEMQWNEVPAVPRLFKAVPADSSTLRVVTLEHDFSKKFPMRAESVPQPRLTITTALGLLEPEFQSAGEVLARRGLRHHPEKNQQSTHVIPYHMPMCTSPQAQLLLGI